MARPLEGEGLIRAFTVADQDEVATHGGRKIWALDFDQLFD